MKGGSGVYNNLRVIAAAILFLPWLMGAGQDRAKVEFTATKLPFIHPERNEIVGAHNLDSFFQKLYEQKVSNSKRISVLQIGDSHIQADFLSAMVRTDFQNDFGNAGRGIVVPLRIAGSNEPFNYKITSNVVCTSKRCVFVDNPMPIGIGGVTIETFNENTVFHIKTFDYPPRNYAFSRAGLFFKQDSTSYNFVIEDTLGNRLGTFNDSVYYGFPNVAYSRLPAMTNDILVKASKSRDNQTHAMIFGLDLENDSSGVVYHAVGVNGAEAFEYTRARYFAEQTAVLMPDLIIISLGTNEAQKRPFDSIASRNQIDSFVTALKTNNPNTPILITTPPDSYYHKKYFNGAVGALHAIWVKYAKENHIAVWDLYSIAGGFRSCYQWKKYRLMRSDGVHFTRQGYEFQANLLYEAIIKAYNNYVSHKHS